MKIEQDRWPSTSEIDGVSRIRKIRSRAIQEMTLRTRYIFDLETVDCEDDFTPPKKGDKFNFTLVSPHLPISFGKYKDYPKERKELYLEPSASGHCILGPSPSYDPMGWFSRRKFELKTVLNNHHSDIILFPEFAFPQSVIFQAISQDQNPDVHKRMNDAIREEFEAGLSLNGSLSDCFVFLGSYHCRKTFYHNGVLLPTGMREKNLEKRSVTHYLSDAYSSIKTDTIDPLVFLPKRFPARRAGEQINVPVGNKLQIYRKKFGNIAVLVCSDALDLNQVTAVVNHNRTSGPHRIDYVLIPSFNRSPQLLYAARELSLLASCMVLVCNVAGKHKNITNVVKNLPPSKVFVCGSDFSPDLHPKDKVKPDIAAAIGVAVKPAQRVSYGTNVISKNIAAFSVINVEVDYHKLRAFACWSSRRANRSVKYDGLPLSK
ncbi:MAG: hypothetical protein AAFP97_09680 [Pseudomonadota bacterium]